MHVETVIELLETQLTIEEFHKICRIIDEEFETEFCDNYGLNDR